MRLQRLSLPRFQMNDTVDQLIDCAQLAGVSASTLLEGAEQIRAVARRRLSKCEPKTSILIVNNETHFDSGVEFSLIEAGLNELGPRPTVTLTLEGEEQDIESCLQAISRAVKDAQPTQPMLDLLRGAKGQPLHILCILAGDNSVLAEHKNNSTDPLYH